MTGRGRARGRGRSGTFRSFRNRNFRLYTIGQLISLTGTAMQQVAQSWLVLSLTDSGVALGVTVALQFGPILLFGAWGGLWADRLDKRKVLLFTQVAQGVLALLLWGLVALGAAELWMVYVLAFLLGVVTALDMPTRQSFTIEMVGPEYVSNAVALNSAVYNSGRLLGPAVAGIMIASVGVEVCFLVNALSYVATVVALRRMDAGQLHRQPTAPRTKGQVREGLAYAWRHPVLRPTLLLVAVVGTFGFNFVVVLPLLVKEVFGGGARLYGVLTSLMGLGSMAGALVVARRRAPTRMVLIGGAGGFGLSATLAAAAPNAATAAVLLVAMGGTMMVFLATANSTLQLTADSRMRGRVMALHGMVFLGSTPVGGPIIGWISEHLGARAGLGVGGVASMVAAVVAGAAVVAARRREGALEGEGPAAAVAAAAAGGAAVVPVPLDRSLPDEAPLEPAPGGGIGPGDAIGVG